MAEPCIPSSHRELCDFFVWALHLLLADAGVVVTLGKGYGLLAKKQMDTYDSKCLGKPLDAGTT